MTVNKALANTSNLPLIGCASHRFNLAVKEYIKSKMQILDKANNLMAKVTQTCGKIKGTTQLKPVRKNETRWTSMFAMIERYMKLRHILSKPEFSADKAIMNLISTARENVEISSETSTT